MQQCKLSSIRKPGLQVELIDLIYDKVHAHMNSLYTLS